MTREDAIKHLENMKWLLGVNNTTVDDIPLTKVIDDIEALLKAQEPRVMTLEEVEQAGKNGDAVYVETADGTRFWALAFPGMEPPKDKPFNYPGGVRFNAQDVDGDIYDGDFYGMTMPDGRVHHMAWRCWTSRPTDEQREAVKWE